MGRAVDESTFRSLRFCLISLMIPSRRLNIRPLAYTESRLSILFLILKALAGKRYWRQNGSRRNPERTGRRRYLEPLCKDGMMHQSVHLQSRQMIKECSLTKYIYSVPAWMAFNACLHTRVVAKRLRRDDNFEQYILYPIN